MPSDSMVIAAGEMPGELVRTAEVQVMRVDPERWVAPHPGSPVRRAAGRERELALYEDTMERTLAIGIGRDGQPIHIDLDFLDGTKGGHVSISGISGVATKTSTALALIRLLLAHEAMRRRVRVLLFNVKGEDLLFLDEPNRTYAARADRARPRRPLAAARAHGGRRLPRRRLLGASAPRRPPAAEQRVAPRGRARLRLDAPRVRAAGPAALLLLRRVGHAQPAELRGGARARRAAAARRAGDRPPAAPSACWADRSRGRPRSAPPGPRAS